MSSNVTIKSNVYINPSGKRDDPAFLMHVTDYQVLKRYQSHSTLIRRDEWMTDTQRQILAQGQPKCSYEKGTMSWGVPVGGTDMVCRCEQSNCPRFSVCSQMWNYQAVERIPGEEHTAPKTRRFSSLPLYSDWKKIVEAAEAEEATDPDSEHADSALESAEKLMDWDLAIDDDDLPVAAVEEQLRAEGVTVPGPAQREKAKGNSGEAEPEESRTAAQEQAGNASAEAETALQADEEESPVADETLGGLRVVDQQTIIQASIHERIWVNAGPGTGKTYTVIRRILYLLEQGEGTILVLCFSRNAVQEIRTRLTAELGVRVNALLDEGSLIIRTFDSFASYMLDDELNPAWDYDRRIRAFTAALEKNADDVADLFDYVIVDELQDTVGVRASMLLMLLKTLPCGFLLLGDRCQSIFDWTVREQEELTFEQLADRLDGLTFRRYELEGNRRQDKKLDRKGQELRRVILEQDEDAQEEAVNRLKEWISENWRSYEVSAFSQVLSGSTDLILCKTNGEASYVSQELFDSAAPVEHVMKQTGNYRALAGWIAMVLDGNDGQYIDREHFMQNAEDHGIDAPDEKWELLKGLDQHPRAAVIHIPELLSALQQMDSLPKACLSCHENAAIVSTVHRAKGSEAEHVYWVDSPLVYEAQEDQDGTKGDAVKAAYVAVTRAKKDIRLLKLSNKRFMKKANDHRWIHFKYSHKNQKIYCKGIAMLPGDVDYASFARGELAEEQQLLLSGLTPGLPVDLYANEEKRRFEIFFDGQLLGLTSLDFTRDLFDGFEATNGNKNWPVAIQEPFISDIITVVAPERTDVNEKYRKMGCWLGIELGGFPQIEYPNYK